MNDEINELKDREAFLNLYIQSMESQFQELQRAYTRLKVENTFLQHQLTGMRQEIESVHESKVGPAKDPEPINTSMVNT